MKLSKIYCSHSNIFRTIKFNDRLNIVLAKVKLPQNKKKTSHSLGKTTLAILIDYCLLKTRNKSDFMWKREDIFEDYIFFLEVKLENNKYCTIKRPVKSRSKVSIKVHNNGDQNFQYLDDKQWDYYGGFKKAKIFLNEKLNFEIAKDYNYRKTLSYFLRRPEDFTDVFRLNKYKRSNDVDWKPILLKLFGYNEDNIVQKYYYDKEFQKLLGQKKTIKKKMLKESEQERRLRLILKEKHDELIVREKEYDNFDFSFADIEKPNKLVNEIDNKISQLVKNNYYIESKIRTSQDSIKEYKVDLKEIARFYKEINIYFSEQLVKDYSELIKFNKAITKERNLLLNEVMQEYKTKYDENIKYLEELNKKKNEIIKYIETSETLEKFKLLQNEIVELKADIINTKEKISSLNEDDNVDEEIKKIDTKIKELVENIKIDLSTYNLIFENIKDIFNQIVKSVLGDIGLLDIKRNSNDNIDFIAEIVDVDTKTVSAKDEGTSFKKLMCSAFDLALLSTYYDKRFYHFIYHDGVFDGLDNRQKENLFDIIDNYCDKFGIQYIFTCIEDELPPILKNDETIKILKENMIIIKELHDEGDHGRLFKMPAF